MADLGELEQCRTELYARLAALEGFRAGSISETWRRDGKPNCAYAQQGHPAPGPGICGPARGRQDLRASAGIRRRGRRLGSSRLTACSPLADKKPIVSLSFSDKELTFASVRGHAL
jgi:Family of unknown function (DUF6788)